MAVTTGVDEETVAAAAQVVAGGGTVIYPTETCYGIGCDATDPEAVSRIYELKDRPREKKLTVIVDSVATAERYAVLTDDERALVERFMPGPLTIVAAKRETFPDVTNTEFAFRIPGNRTARTLAREAGVPVVATSANLSGSDENYRVDDIAPQLRQGVDRILDAGELARQEPSTVIGIREEELTVHREGPVTRTELEAVLHGD